MEQAALCNCVYLQNVCLKIHGDVSICDALKRSTQARVRLFQRLFSLDLCRDVHRSAGQPRNVPLRIVYRLQVQIEDAPLSCVTDIDAQMLTFAAAQHVTFVVSQMFCVGLGNQIEIRLADDGGWGGQGRRDEGRITQTIILRENVDGQVLQRGTVEVVAKRLTMIFVMVRGCSAHRIEYYCRR